MVGFAKKIAALVAVFGFASAATLPAIAATQGTSTDCTVGASSTAGVFVAIMQANIEGKPAGSYTGTLTLVITPT